MTVRTGMNVRINPHVRWRWEGDKLLLNNLMILNRSGGEILELLESMKTIETAAETLHSLYDILYEKALKDVLQFCEILKEWNIVIPDTSTDYGLKVCPEYMKMIGENFQNVLSAPVEVSCEVTSRCNAKCMHCSVSETRSYTELATEAWQKIIGSLSELKVFSILLTGGEPLLRRDLEEVVRMCASQKMITGISTNGYLLSEERIDSLVSAGAVGFAISLDGIDARTHDTFRGLEGLYDRVIAAIEMLVEKKVELGVLVCITKMNLNQITDIIQLLDNMGVSQVSLLRLKMTGRAKETPWLNPDVTDYITLLKKIHLLQKELETMTILYPDVPMKFFEKSVGADFYETLKKEGKIELCGAGIISCAISSNGNIKPCDISGDVSLGNIAEHSLKEVWDSSSILKGLRTLNKKDYTPCGQCTLNQTCLTGCKALPSQVDGVLTSADPVCVECFSTFKEEVAP